MTTSPITSLIETRLLKLISDLEQPVTTKQINDYEHETIASTVNRLKQMMHKGMIEGTKVHGRFVWTVIKKEEQTHD